MLGDYSPLSPLERKMLFVPARYPAGDWQPTTVVYEDVHFQAADGVRLHGWYVPHENPRAHVVFLHGNGGNITQFAEGLRTLNRRHGLSVLIFDYRGYGRSEGSISDERGLYEDAAAAYDFAVRARGAAPTRLVLYGQSLGTAAAAELAAERPCGALVLESGLSSAADMARVVLPWLPRAVARLTKNRFDSVGKLPRAGCPVLVAHGDRDEIIPVEQGRALYAAAPEPKRLHIVNGAGHNDLNLVGGEKYLDALADFINSSIR